MREGSEVIEDSVVDFIAESPTTASLARALERCWVERTGLEQMGLAGARRIRQLVPADPISDFANKLVELARAPMTVSDAPARRRSITTPERRARV
jgi:hypothetical protein